MKFNPGKILIVGAGSIGQRHLRNIKKIGAKEICIVEPNRKKRQEVARAYEVKGYENYRQALGEEWGAVFISTPPVSHVEIALAFAKKNVPLFIEKPLSSDLKNGSELLRLTKKGKVPVMVGYNLRFHPFIRKAKDMVERGLLGKIWGVRADAGQYLPDWHPWEDYRRGYSAQKKLGGGIVLDCIHEIDYFCWFFGFPKQMSSVVRKISNLLIDTEDYAEIIFSFPEGIIGELHVDYLQRVPCRTFKIVGEKGTLLCDLRNSELQYFLIKEKKWRREMLKNFDWNETYVKETKYFFDCLRKNEMPLESDLVNGYETLKVALHAKKSSDHSKSY